MHLIFCTHFIDFFSFKGHDLRMFFRKILRGCLVCVICYSNNFHSLIFKLCIIIVYTLNMCTYYFVFVPGRVAQLVTCLATDACLTADPGVASSIPARSLTFVEIDHEIISTVILLPSDDLFKKGCCQLQAKVCARITG